LSNTWPASFYLALEKIRLGPAAGQLHGSFKVLPRLRRPTRKKVEFPLGRNSNQFPSPTISSLA
jgi:hypothetical protein